MANRLQANGEQGVLAAGTLSLLSVLTIDYKCFLSVAVDALIRWEKAAVLGLQFAVAKANSLIDQNNLLLLRNEIY